MVIQSLNMLFIKKANIDKIAAAMIRHGRAIPLQGNRQAVVLHNQKKFFGVMHLDKTHIPHFPKGRVST